MQKLYSNGFPFSDKLDKNLDSLIERIDKKKASLVVIDGGVGEGKTTLAVHCADYVQKGEVNFKDQYAMGGDEFQEKLEICKNKKLKVLIYDEAGDFDKRGALTAFNKRLNRIFQTYRGFKILIIMVLPNFNILDNNLFELKIPRLLLNCHGRNNKYGNYSGYSLYRMHYIRSKMNHPRTVIKEHAYKQVSPNFQGHYYDISADRSRKLERISLDGKAKILTDNILESKGLISTQQIMKKLSRSKVWVYKKLEKLQITEELIHKKKKYYDNSVLDMLRDEMVNK